MIQKKYTAKHVAYTCIVILIISGILFVGTISRDYKIVFKNGISLVAKTRVPAAPGFSIDNSIPEKITVNIMHNGSVGYDVQISRFENMSFGKIYRTALPYKERGLMKGGVYYYVRVRSVAVVPNTSRKVHGQWGAVRKVLVREKHSK